MSFPDPPEPQTPKPATPAAPRRSVLVPTIAVLMVLTSLIGAFAQTITEYFWFEQVGYAGVFTTRLWTQIALFALGALVMAAVVFGNMWLAYRYRPLYAPTGLEQTSMERYRQAVEPVRKAVALAIPAGLGLFAGSALSSQWMTVQTWLNRTPFGERDPEYGLDVGFYVFSLPLLRFAVGFGFALVVMSLICAALVHYVYGGLRLGGEGPRTSVTARVQLSLLLALFLALRAAGYFLDRYSLLINDTGRFTGAGYTDVNAVIPAATILAGIAVLVAGLFVATAFTGGWRLPVVGVSLMVISALVVGSAYPAAIQRFQVKPSEQTKEVPFLQRNIDATRNAYDIDGTEVIEYDPALVAQPGALRADAETTASIRLLDPALVSPAFRQLQRVKQYYTFPDPLDVDRYTIDGVSRDAVVSVRELDQDGLPDRNRSWVNDHTVFTHGFGFVAAYGAKRADGGQPLFIQSGIPSTGELGEFEPRIYFGEKSPDYSIVGAPESAEPKELDFPTDEGGSGQANTTFAGDGGPSIGAWWQRLLYAVKFRDQNILLSDAINSESQVLYDRHPRERIAKVAPWLTLDGDPYPAIVDGRIKWIVDGYTVTRNYPYSDVQPLGEITQDQITRNSDSVTALRQQEVNYIRNSVKATVDAYDGSIDLYAWDDDDPLLQTWRQVFPGTVKPLSEIGDDLMSHLRYPEDLFKVQRTVLGQYHVEGAAEFYSGQDFWKVPNEPTAENPAVASAQPPYYLTLRMPGQDASSFSLTSTFIPDATQGSTASVLTGFMAVDADAGDTGGQKDDGYGTIRMLQLPRNTTVNGPGQVQNDFNSDEKAATELNLLARGDSAVLRGNLLTLPVGNGLLYVQPVYVKSAGETAYPLLRKVLVLFGSEVGFADTLDEALDQVFGGDSGASAGDAGTATDPDESTDPADPGPGDSAGGEPVNPDQDPRPEPSTDLAGALADAQRAILDGEEALKVGDFAAYGEAQERLQAALERAVAAQDGGAGQAPSDGSAEANSDPVDESTDG